MVQVRGVSAILKNVYRRNIKEGIVIKGGNTSVLKKQIETTERNETDRRDRNSKEQQKGIPSIEEQI